METIGGWVEDLNLQSEVVVAVIALLFTVGSFWWLYARRGHLAVSAPRSYAFAAQESHMVLRLPLAFYNTGASSLVVVDLRIVFVGEANIGSMPWVATALSLEPSKVDGQEFTVPFAVDGRRVDNVIAEFLRLDPVAAPEPLTEYRLRLEGVVGQKAKWVTLLDFDWTSPPDVAKYPVFTPYRNPPSRD